jgi:spectinomycin phosphotransferase
MKKREFPSDKSISDWIKLYYNIESNFIAPLAEGADMNAALYKVQANDQSYFVKLKHSHENDINLSILELLHRRGVQEIILPISTIHGGLIQHIEDISLIVYPFIDGVNGFNQKLTDNQWIQLGNALKQVHETKVSDNILKLIKHEIYSPKWRKVARSLFMHNDSHSNDPLAINFLNYINDQRLVLERLIDRAEELSLLIRDQPVDFVLCHSDIHAGNVLMKNEGAIYLVDWDEPILAPKERDLMFIGGGVGNVWNDHQEETLFYKGYGKVDVNTSLLSYYRHERIVQDIAEYGEAFLQNSDDTLKNRSEMYEHFLSMFDSQGVIDIAFKTG